MFKFREKSHLFQNDETFFCSSLYRSVEFCRSLQIQTMTKLPEITKITPTNHVHEMLQQQHFINASTNPKGCHMSNFIGQNEINMTNELLKVQQPLLV